MRLSKIAIALLVVALLGGCAGSKIDNERKARAAYEASVADYRGCLAANEANIKACEGKRVAMEMEERHWTNLSSDVNEILTGGPTLKSTVTVQSR